MVGGAVPLAVFPVCGGDLAAGPLTRRHAVSPQLKAISLEYSHADLAAATSNFHNSKRLGAGCYGAVYRGEMKDGSDVAIKAIDLSILMGKGECPQDAGFDEEVQLLSKFRHPHLVTLLGWGQHGLHRYLVYEFLSGGDVFQRLHKSRTGQLNFPWHERLSVLLDAASGLSHMVNATPKAFHRDIKSANILLDRHHTAKMADFGLACTSHHGGTNVTVKSIGGTPGYKCPVYERSGRCTEGSEVYSFGMVMLEVLTGLAPSSTDPTVPGGISFPIAETVAPGQPGALERMRGGDATAEWPPILFTELATMALRCVEGEKLRPSFVDLVRFLKVLVERFPKTPKTGSAVTSFPSMQVLPSWRPPATPLANASRQSEDVKSSPPKRLSDEDLRKLEGRSHYVLELHESAGCKIEALSPSWRWLPLTRIPGNNSAVVGRHVQNSLFEAWLPIPQRACISRKAIEIFWEATGEAKLVSCGSNPVLVDGLLVEKGAAQPLKVGSEIIFTYDSKVLLRFLYMAFEDSRFTPPWSLECSRLVSNDLERWKLPLLAGVSSVTEAVERLNSGISKCSNGLCLVFCPAERQYFLLYRKDCQAALADVTDVFRPPNLAWTPPEEAFCELRCLEVQGMTMEQVQALPLELREMPVPQGQSFIKAEAFLRDDDPLKQALCQLLYLDAERKGALHLRLARSSPGGLFFYVDEEELTDAVLLHHNQVLRILRGTGPLCQQVVLSFQVHWPDEVSSSFIPEHLARRVVANVLPAKSGGGSSNVTAATRTHEIPPFASCENHSQPAEGSGGLLPPPRCRPKQMPVETEAPEVFLELSGSSAKELPAPQRRLGPVTLGKDPWIIGRRHQKDFLQRAVKEDSLEFISRDHFAIAYQESSFLLLALSQNRIWLNRGKVLGIRSLQQDEMMPLRPGDRILLGTAPDDATRERKTARLDFLFRTTIE